MRRTPLRLAPETLPFEVFPDGRVLVTLPPTELPFGAAIQTTVLYPSLRAFVAARRRLRDQNHT
jgi:hypothetical protein